MSENVVNEEENNLGSGKNERHPYKVIANVKNIQVLQYGHACLQYDSTFSYDIVFCFFF